jgi:hypothetical protein
MREVYRASGQMPDRQRPAHTCDEFGRRLPLLIGMKIESRILDQTKQSRAAHQRLSGPHRVTHRHGSRNILFGQRKGDSQSDRGARAKR